MPDTVAGLNSTLRNLARTTWTDIADGRQLGVGIGEVGITDRNMLALRREHPSLVVHKHPAHEEIRTGADWEWWIGAADGWLCLVFQAKLLDINGRYSGITRGRAEGKPQVDVLLKSCLLRSEKLNGAVWPLYCFYNNWQGGWPANVMRYDRTEPESASDQDLRLYGCAVINAWHVRQVLLDSQYSNRRTLRDSYLPVSRPWSLLFDDSTGSSGRGPGKSISTMLPAWMPARARKRLEPSTNDLDKVTPGELRRRDRMTIYYEPTPISRPPDYVFDLLEGASRPRRLKPLARRTVILSDLS